MRSQSGSKRGKRSSLLKSSGWLTRRYELLRECLALATNNGATKDSDSCETDDYMSNEQVLTEEQRLVELEDHHPASTHAERLRFLRACKGSLNRAIAKLQGYLDWREIHGLDLPEYQEARMGSTSDEQDWSESCRRAMKYAEKTGSITSEGSKRKSSRSKKSKSRELPQIAFAYCDAYGAPKKTINGRLLLHLLPARINKKLAPAETYALALGFYLDRKQDRSSLDLFFVMMDIRGGKGWANPPAYNMMPFVKATAPLLHQHYPERLDKLFVYPLPRPALWIWELAKPLLDRSAVESAHLIGGKDTCSSPPPNHALREFVHQDLLDEMENKRLSMYKETTASSRSRSSSRSSRS